MATAAGAGRRIVKGQHGAGGGVGERDWLQHRQGRKTCLAAQL